MDNPYAPKNTKPGILIASQAKEKHNCQLWFEGRTDRILNKEQNKVNNKYYAYIQGWESVDPR